METTSFPIEDTRNLYAVYINSDRMDGLGYNYPRYFCESLYTAQRLAKGGDVMGSDGAVTKVSLVKINGGWYAPFSLGQLERASSEDRAAQERDRVQLEAETRRIAATEKAKALGLTDDDIRALTAVSSSAE